MIDVEGFAIIIKDSLGRTQCTHDDRSGTHMDIVCEPAFALENNPFTSPGSLMVIPIHPAEGATIDLEQQQALPPELSMIEIEQIANRVDTDTTQGSNPFRPPVQMNA